MGAQGPKTPEYPPLDDALSNNPNFDTSFDTNFDTDSWARFDREYGLGDDYPDGPRRILRQHGRAGFRVNPDTANMLRF